MYQNQADSALCLFYKNWWKVDRCVLNDDDDAVGFLLSKQEPSKLFPQDVGAAWSTYSTPDIVNAGIIIKCKSYFFQLNT